MEDKFIWEEDKTGDILIKQLRNDGKYYKVATLDDDNIPDFAVVWTQIQGHVRHKIQKQLDKLNKLNNIIFTPSTQILTIKDSPPIDRKDNQKPVHPRQEISPVKMVDSKGDVKCGTCNNEIVTQTQLFLCTVCSNPTHPECGEDGACNACLSKA